MRTKWKIVGAIAVLLLLIAITVQIFIDRWLEPVIRKRLETLIIPGSDSLYNFQLDSIRVNFWSGSVELQNLHVKVDSLHYAQREKAGNLPALTAEINLSKGSINNIRLLQLVFNKKISIGTILSKNTNITISRHFKKSKQKIGNTMNEPLWKLLQPDISSIKIDRILLNDINLNYSNADSATAFHWKFEHCSATIDNIRIDSAATADTSRMLFTKDIAIVFNNIKMQMPDALYSIESKQLHYSSEKRTLTAEDFKLQTVLNRQATYRKIGYDKDLFSLDFPKLNLIDFQLPLWINKNILSIGTLEFSKPVVHVYKDRTMKTDTRSKFGKYPHQLLANAPFTIYVGQIKVNDALLTYTEKNQKTATEGKLIFQRLDGTIKNITNDHEQIKRNPRCVVDIQGIFMNRSPLHAMFTFYLDETDKGTFETVTDMERINATELNPITTALAQTAVKSFDIKKLHYSIKGNEKAGVGNLKLLYNNLAVELQKQDEKGDKMKGRKFLSFIVNKLVVYPDNPMKDEERKAMGIRVERIRYKSFFNLVWKTLFASVKEITIRVDALKKDNTKKTK